MIQILLNIDIKFIKCSLTIQTFFKIKLSLKLQISFIRTMPIFVNITQ